ncbi:DUF6252 family protein [Flavobacterium sp.]|uniref:DUF6252 family protein n=1 Tax=Flavobacterium sp. TaxID=239 RepID=UPI000EBC6926|nr:DUF6252 family protein [Flavobacterium sp.]HCQ13563.1 hypothetical protein [Flavobacterium sp.]
MKNIKFLSALVVLFSAFTFTSCDNEPIDSALNPDDFGGGGNANASFKADFNGATWTANSSQAIVSGNLIQIAGVKSDGSTFGFLIEASTTGTYPANENLLAFNPAGSEYGYWATNINNPTENTGSITITSIDTVNKKISGTFSFKGYWSNADETGVLPIDFTNGVFTNVPYINMEETGDTFFAKVNGTEFVDVDILTTEIGVGSQDFISIAAQNSALDAITVSVRSDQGVGTYPITGNVATDVVQAIYDFNDANYLAVSGTVTIQEKTATHIKGTFSFVTNGATPFTISEGSFDVDY